MASYDVVGRGAVFGPGGKLSDYRYRLDRVLAEPLGGRDGRVVWVMLNPSVADEFDDDPTIRRCMGFTIREGYHELSIVNLYALRSPDPTTLRRHTDPLGGPYTDHHIVDTCRDAALIICAWGSNEMVADRATAVRALLDDRPLWALGFNKDGQPKHPLYVNGTARLLTLNAAAQRQRADDDARRRLALG